LSWHGVSFNLCYVLVNAAGSTGRCNTIWYKADFKGGVYDPRETVWTFCGAEERHVVPDVKVYFCDPQSPWQRGSNENTNGLLRQYFPKRTDLSGYTQSKLDKVALRLNQRPRKTLGFQTPASKLRATVASTR
jgi:hypothetical protein